MLNKLFKTLLMDSKVSYKNDKFKKIVSKYRKLFYETTLIKKYQDNLTKKYIEDMKKASILLYEKQQKCSHPIFRDTIMEEYALRKYTIRTCDICGASIIFEY